MKICHAIDGGRVCMEMPLFIVGPARSVPLFQKVNI